MDKNSLKIGDKEVRFGIHNKVYDGTSPAFKRFAPILNVYLVEHNFYRRIVVDGEYEGEDLNKTSYHVAKDSDSLEEKLLLEMKDEISTLPFTPAELGCYIKERITVDDFQVFALPKSFDSIKFTISGFTGSSELLNVYRIDYNLIWDHYTRRSQTLQRRVTIEENHKYFAANNKKDALRQFMRCKDKLVDSSMRISPDNIDCSFIEQVSVPDYDIFAIPWLYDKPLIVEIKTKEESSFLNRVIKRWAFGKAKRS